MSDWYFNMTFGALEWNPNYPGHQFSYREDLNRTNRFKQVINFSESEIWEKIEIAQRLLYFKESVVNNNFDE